MRQEIFKIAKWFILVSGVVVALIRAMELYNPAMPTLKISDIEDRLEKKIDRIEKRLDMIYNYLIRR